MRCAVASLTRLSKCLSNIACSAFFVAYPKLALRRIWNVLGPPKARPGTNDGDAMIVLMLVFRRLSLIYVRISIDLTGLSRRRVAPIPQCALMFADVRAYTQNAPHFVYTLGLPLDRPVLPSRRSMHRFRRSVQAPCAVSCAPFRSLRVCCAPPRGTNPGIRHDIN